jgi:hypothetical protein
MKTESFMRDYFGPLSVRWAIINDAWLAGPFVHKAEHHLGGTMHGISSPAQAGPGKFCQLVGFGGEVWRGRYWFTVEGDKQTALGLELIPNFDCTPERLALTTAGLALLMHCKYGPANFHDDTTKTTTTTNERR